MTDYNDGKWHGWNGGKCPVHPESVVEVLHAETGVLNERRAGITVWEHEYLIAFRVIREHKEPVVTTHEGECWAYHYTCMEPSLASFNVGGNCIYGTWIATHVDGKLKSFTWTSDND